MIKKIVAVVLSTFLLGCGGKGEEKKEVKNEKVIVTVAQAAKPKTLDPPLANQVASMTVARQVFNTLLAVDDEGNLIPE